MAVGTHPDPAYRMRYTFSNIMATLSHPEVKKYVPWAGTTKDLYSVMLHAFNAANMYMQIAHFDEPGFPQFMTRMIDETKDAVNYRENIRLTWESLRPKFMQEYFGWGDSCVMPPLNEAATEGGESDFL